MSYGDLFRAVVPEAIVALTAFLVLGADLALWRRQRPDVRRKRAVALGGIGCLLAFLWLGRAGNGGWFCEGMLVNDPLTQGLKQALLVLTGLTGVLLIGSEFTEHIGEFTALLLLATTGMMLLVSSEDLLMLFLSLEMTSLCLYGMTAFDRRSPRSAEAGLKYFLFGGTVAAVLLFGLSLIYGLAHSTNLREIGRHVGQQGAEPALYLALVMVVAGLAFKVAAVPFHPWAPDTYQGAPAPAAAFIASGSKVASFFVLAKLMLVSFAGVAGSAAWGHFAPGWIPVLATLAALSMLLGNLAALAQHSVRRLLAYSAIAHAGYALTGLLANNADALPSLLYYVTTYALTVVGAFAVAAVVQEEAGNDRLEAFAGLSGRSPVLALGLLVFVLSLAGIPPLAGFFGKFYVFTAAVRSAPENLGLLWLVALGVGMSAASLYYYLQVLKQAWVAPPAAARPLVVPWTTALAVILLAVAVVALGCAPEVLLAKLERVIKLGG